MDQSSKFQIEVLAYLVRHANGDTSALSELKTMIDNETKNQPQSTETANYRSIVVSFAAKAKLS